VFGEASGSALYRDFPHVCEQLVECVTKASMFSQSNSMSTGHVIKIGRTGEIFQIIVSMFCCVMSTTLRHRYYRIIQRGTHILHDNYLV